MTIKPILKYPGSKYSAAPWIVSQFPAHTHYLEPFFGSGIVLLNKPQSTHEAINDVDDNIVNLFRVLRERGDELARLIELTPWARAEYEVCKHERSSDSIEQARRFVVQCWQGHGSSAGGRGSGWKHGGRNGAKQMVTETWARIPDRIRAVIERLRMVEIEHRPALEVIDRYATKETLIYADPPYPKSTRNGRFYTHDYMTDADHADLLDVLDQHSGPVVLSGYACALYDDRLVHWARRTKEVQAESGGTRTEVLWLNPACVDRLGYGPLFKVQL